MSISGQEIKVGDNITVKRDLRYVNGLQVDLTPIHNWMLNHQGDRPLKHWKQLQVYQIKEYLMGCEHCVVKTEDGGFLEILIRNVPDSVMIFLSRLKAQEADIASLNDEIEKASP